MLLEFRILGLEKGVFGFGVLRMRCKKDSRKFSVRFQGFVFRPLSLRS